MSQEEPNNIVGSASSVLSIASIRSNIFAKIKSIDLTVDNPTDSQKCTDGADTSDRVAPDEAASVNEQNRLNDEKSANSHLSQTETETETILLKSEDGNDGKPLPESADAMHVLKPETMDHDGDAEDTRQADDAIPQCSTQSVMSEKIVVKTEVEDNDYPFQGDLALTSTDFSQIVAQNADNVIVKQEKTDSVSETTEGDLTLNVQEDISVTRVEYRIVDSDSEGTADSDSDSDDSSTPDAGEAPAPKDRVSDDEELFGIRRPVKNRQGFDDMRTQGEVFPEELPPLEYLTIDIGEGTELQEIGVIDSIVGVLVVIRSTVEHSPLQDDSVFFLEDRKPLGQVFEIMGQVRMPFYSIRFNSEEDIVEKGAKVGKPVFFAPTVPEITHYVFVSHLQKLKGSDASWENNNEPPQSHLDFSDDEEERRAKVKQRNKKKGDAEQGEGTSDDEDAETGGKKSRRRNRHSADGDQCGRGRGRRDRFGRGRGRGGNQSHSTDYLSGRWPPSDWASKRFGPRGPQPHFDWDHPGKNSGPPPSSFPAQFGQSGPGPQPWAARAPGAGVLRMPRFPPSHFAPPPSVVSPWGALQPPFVPPSPAGNGPPGPHSGPHPFGSPPPPPQQSMRGGSPAFQSTAPNNSAPSGFNPNVPPPPFGQGVPSSQTVSTPSQNGYSTGPAMNSGFGSQPQFSAGRWGPGFQGPGSGVSVLPGTNFNNFTGSSSSTGESSVNSQGMGTSTSNAAGKQPVLDTRYIQNSGD